MFVGVSPVVDSWPMMGSPFPLTSIFIGYLVIVFLIAPKLMKTRPPLGLNWFTRCYNVAQILFCAWTVNWCRGYGASLATLWKCSDDSMIHNDRIIPYKTVQWWFLMVRLAELSETIVFVLRKKQNQVSFLHVYHHISTPVIVWISAKYAESKFH